MDKQLVLIADGIPDSSGDCLKIIDVEVPVEELPVTLDTPGCTRKIIGMAKLIKEDENIYATIRFLETNEAKLAKKLQQQLTPCVAGKIMNRYGVNNEFIIPKIEEIMLSLNNNSDSRIPKIKQ